MVKDKLKGGFGDKVDRKLFDQKQLKKGISVEMEHTNDKKLATEIATDHLTEFQDYYKELEKMEFKMDTKRVIEFYNDGSLKYVDKRYLMKNINGYHLIHQRYAHFFDVNKNYIESRKL